MKILSLVFSLLLTFNFFSQQVVIQVDEVQSYFGDTTSTMAEIFEKKYNLEPQHKNCRYIIDFRNKEVSFFRDGELIDHGSIKVGYENEYTVVEFLNDGFNYGLILNLDIHNELVVLYQIDDDKVEYMNFTRFQILKPM